MIVYRSLLVLLTTALVVTPCVCEIYVRRHAHRAHEPRIASALRERLRLSSSGDPLDNGFEDVFENIVSTSVQGQSVVFFGEQHDRQSHREAKSWLTEKARRGELYLFTEAEEFDEKHILRWLLLNSRGASTIASSVHALQQARIGASHIFGLTDVKTRLVVACFLGLLEIQNHAFKQSFDVRQKFVSILLPHADLRAELFPSLSKSTLPLDAHTPGLQLHDFLYMFFCMYDDDLHAALSSESLRGDDDAGIDDDDATTALLLEEVAAVRSANVSVWIPSLDDLFPSAAWLTVFQRVGERLVSSMDSLPVYTRLQAIWFFRHPLEHAAAETFYNWFCLDYRDVLFARHLRSKLPQLPDEDKDKDVVVIVGLMHIFPMIRILQ